MTILWVIFGQPIPVTDTTGIRNTAVGYAADVSMDSLTNATAIGSNAWVDCSNCLVLGSVGLINGASSGVNVGIGTNTPGFPLNFANTFGDKISFKGVTGAHYGIGIARNLMQIHTDVIGADVAFGYGTSGSLTETLRIRGNGNVGIGTTFPNAKLEVSGNLRFTNVDCINGFYPPSGAIRLTPNLHLKAGPDQAVIVNWDNTESGSYNYSFRVGNGYSANAFYVTYPGDSWLAGTLIQASDIRLKKDIIPLQNSLQKIIQINGYNYHWKSEKSNSDL